MVHGVWRGSRTVVVAINNRELARDEDSDAYVATIDELLADPAEVERFGVLAISDGGVPTARQRGAILDTIGARIGAYLFPWALISSSRLARGAANALAAHHPRFKAFEPNELGRAAGHLGVAEDELPALWDAIRQVDRAIGSETVAEIAASM